MGLQLFTVVGWLSYEACPSAPHDWMLWSVCPQKLRMEERERQEREPAQKISKTFLHERANSAHVREKQMLHIPT